MENSEGLKIEKLDVDSSALKSLTLKEQMEKLAGKISNEKRREAAGLLDELEGKVAEITPRTDNDKGDR